MININNYKIRSSKLFNNNKGNIFYTTIQYMIYEKDQVSYINKLCLEKSFPSRQ